MKIVLPLAGKGTRLLPHTQKTPKPLMEIAGKSILAHLMDELIPLQPEEFVFIVGYLKEQIQGFITANYPNLPARFIEQINPQGLGHAILQAEPAFGQDAPMLVILGDQTFTIDWGKMLEAGANRLSTFAVADASSFGVVLADARGKVLEMEEKPAQPKANTIISGTYYFKSAERVFDTLKKQVGKDIRTRGEIQITDTMCLMMEEGEEFFTLPISDWNDCGNHADLIRANGVLIAKKGLNSIDCIRTPADYHKIGAIGSTKIEKATLMNIEAEYPVFIHPSATVENCKLGPNVSIGAGAKASHCTLKDCVITAGASLQNCRLEGCYITENLADCTEQNLYR